MVIYLGSEAHPQSYDYKNKPELPEICQSWNNRRLIDYIHDFESQGIACSEIAIRNDFNAAKAGITGDELLGSVSNQVTHEVVYFVRVGGYK